MPFVISKEKSHKVKTQSTSLSGCDLLRLFAIARVSLRRNDKLHENILMKIDLAPIEVEILLWSFSATKDWNG